MTEAELAALPLADLLHSYREAALNHAAASMSGRHRVANRAFDSLSLLRAEIVSRGARGIDALRGLLADAEDGVRLWAATHCLAFAAAEAQAALEEVAAHAKGSVGLSAEMTLSEWRAGRLQT
jgi:hypothetical protein